MARKVELLPRAARELSALPMSIQDQILGKLEMLREFPEMGAPMLDAFEGYRSLLAARNRYRVVYRVVSDDLVEVAYVRHGARQVGLRVVRARGRG
ncbi:MAG: type II toxin-antitoxin system RelE family toxin [Candidatus Binatia bacterium]